MNNSILEAKNVSKKYEGKTVLQDISLLAGKGEAIGLVGVNGCGKSTLLRILSEIYGSYVPYGNRQGKQG